MIFANVNDVPAADRSGATSFSTSDSVTFVDERVNPASLSVEYFSFDSLRLRIDTGRNSSTVLYYADSWNPGWHATVNGVPTPVVRANLGFKAIVLPAGLSTVVLTYGSGLDRLTLSAVVALGLISFISVIFVFYDTIIDKEVRGRELVGGGF
jgi:uncharacterized membrane protein YfhO